MVGVTPKFLGNQMVDVSFLVVKAPGGKGANSFLRAHYWPSSVTILEGTVVILANERTRI